MRNTAYTVRRGVEYTAFLLSGRLLPSPPYNLYSHPLPHRKHASIDDIGHQPLFYVVLPKTAAPAPHSPNKEPLSVQGLPRIHSSVIVEQEARRSLRSWMPSAHPLNNLR